MKKVAFYTLGCKVNQYETEAMLEMFKEDGYEQVGSEDFADVYVINTCTVTHMSDRKSRQYIRRMKKKNPNAIIAVVGCYSQVSPEEILEIDSSYPFSA
ncbi:MAG TPA: tRNA (N(6)-L-threonylcarbamoyladenosine(37)-C(2))-methylthiotransferase MtaB, partial [Terrisporobacter glycolicus]|nr:tRNA (N(6)-L-threonylcarbamoyladenosine(37)-C(2))-methylthiotransferase MtaB [Terrisporobacter hibernicus]